MFFKKVPFPFAMLAACLSSTVQAGVSVGATRVIYDGDKKEASLSVSNPDKFPYLIQVWVENPNVDTEKAPFIITPPLFRLEQEQQNVMRIVRSGNLPENRESLFWLNVKAIPSSTKKENTLQIAIKTRIKLIYRPRDLQGSAEDQADKLTWSRIGNQLKVTNPSSFYMNFNEITVAGKKVPEVVYVAPGSAMTYNLVPNTPPGQIEFRLINDYGSTGTSHKAMAQ